MKKKRVLRVSKTKYFASSIANRHQSRQQPKIVDKKDSNSPKNRLKKKIMDKWIEK